MTFAPSARHWLALAALTTASGLAAAQSSVTVFGVIDIGVQRLSNGPKSLSMMSIDGLQTSRLGFRGTEDLGGGMTASFHLEGALSPDTGGSALDFRRRSTVSLSGKSTGELRVGRDYTPTFWNISRFNAFGTNGVGAASNLIYGFDGLSSTASTIVRSNNSVGYFLPGDLGGVYGQAMYAFGEGAPGKYVGARLGYAAGPLDVAGSISDTENNVAGDKFRVTSLGATYALGDAKLMALLHNSKQTTREQKNWVLGATYALGVTTLRASYVHSAYSNSANEADYSGRLIALGVVHPLSKRTSLYATTSRVSNSATGKFVISGGSTVTAGQGSRGTEFGVYHTF
jgi:predicted porin